MQKIKLFVPGRLCLFGEHSDWAGMYRTINPDIVPGEAIVTGIEQGIYATAEKADNFIIESPLEIYHGERVDSPMDSNRLETIAQRGGFFSYVAGTAAYMNDNYSVKGVKITVTEMDLPLKSGLSSSAAICVLVARAFNQLYNLKMSIQEEMQAAYEGEQKTPSRCGRLDQACAYGVRPVRMTFNGNKVSTEELSVGAEFHYVIANLMSSKDTVKILSDLNKCYPFAQGKEERRVQEALGEDNRRFCREAKKALADGNAEALGCLMNEWQKNFDLKVSGRSSELTGPTLHAVLDDPQIKTMVLGAKGVGSQGDGSVQFLTKDRETAQKLEKYLKDTWGMPSNLFSLTPQQPVRKAVITLAGYGTRMFPVTHVINKAFLPLPDTDGTLKPALFMLVEELDKSGIEEIALVIGKGERGKYEELFDLIKTPAYANLPEDKKRYAEHMTKLSKKITYIEQDEKLGLGHAVYLTREFADGEPVLLLLGDFAYRSQSATLCCKQIIDAYRTANKPLVSVTDAKLSETRLYGFVSGQWLSDKILAVCEMVEKPSEEYAWNYLGIEEKGKKKFYKTFGQYVLTEEVYEELEKEVNSHVKESGEIQLTPALNRVASKGGLAACIPEGKSYDIGTPQLYIEAVKQM